MKTKITPLLSVRLTVDAEDRKTDVYSYLKLFREETGLIWRIDGVAGDECETLPRPDTIAQAKDDIRQAYQNGPFRPLARWLPGVGS